MYCIYTYPIEIHHNAFLEIKDLPNKRDLTWFWGSGACLSLLYSVICHENFTPNWHFDTSKLLTSPPPNQLPSRACVETCPDPLLHPKRRLRPKGYLKDNPKTADLVSRSLNLNPRMPGICHGRKQFLEVGLPLQPLIDLNWDRVPRLLMGQNCWDG